VLDLEKRLDELTSQVQLLHEQFAGLQATVYFVEVLLLLFFVGGAGIFLWLRVKAYQAMKGSAYMRTRVAPPNDSLHN
jgi:hypothetical protein